MKNLIFIFVGLIFFQTSSFAASENMHLIAVNGVAEVSVEPNMVVLQIESWAKSSTAKVAQEIQAKQFLQIKNIVDKFKIKKEDFKTENFTINPDTVYDQKTQSNRITGYRVSHNVSLVFRKTEDVGQLIDALSSAGGVSIQSIAWDYDKKNIVENSALGEAVRSARSRAEELAKAAGVRIKAVHLLQHSTGFSSVRPMTEKAGFALVADKMASTELSTGQVKVTVNVQVEFEIESR